MFYIHLKIMKLVVLLGGVQLGMADGVVQVLYFLTGFLSACSVNY